MRILLILPRTTFAKSLIYLAISFAVYIFATEAWATIDLREQHLLALIEQVGSEPWGVSLAGGLSYCH